jgi:hypothetical protein
VHGFLVIRNERGAVIGTGDAVNVPDGRAWRSRTILHFRDGSVDDETAIYTQNGSLHLVSDHHVQKGPSFPKPIDMFIDTARGCVTWHDIHEGRDEVKTEQMSMPADLANGLLPFVSQNLPQGGAETKVGYLAATPKPRLITMAIHRDGEESFRIGGMGRKASRMRVHLDLGGIAGVIAPIIGKEPPDMYLTVVEGQAPAFQKVNGILYLGGPLFTIELASPEWSDKPAH